jgi:hypothetical protein
VCGCDGKVVEGDFASCSVKLANKAINHDEACQTGTFPCGPTLVCKRNSDVCVEKLQAAPAPTSYECTAFHTFKSLCGGIPSCNCLDMTGLGSFSCTVDADNQETLTFPAP